MKYWPYLSEAEEPCEVDAASWCNSASTASLLCHGDDALDEEHGVASQADASHEGGDVEVLRRSGCSGREQRGRVDGEAVAEVETSHGCLMVIWRQPSSTFGWGLRHEETRCSRLSNRGDS